MKRRLDPLRAASVALPLVAAVFAGWSGWSWHGASHSAALAANRARDNALQAGEQAVQNFNTLDYRKVRQGLNLWEQSSTGGLRAEIVAGHAQFEQQVVQARTVTSAQILDAALTSLDIRAGTATIIVAVQVTVTPAHGAPVIKQNRLEGVLTRTPDGWKLSALGQVPVAGAATPSG